VSLLSKERVNMQTFTKSFKGKTLKALAQLETHKDGDSWAASGYCPWCSEIKRSAGKAKAKRAADAVFSIIESHWKIAHKDK